MKRWEIYIYALLIIGLNICLAAGTFAKSMIFLPQQVIDGQLWRLFTHPFVHVTWYHLLLDGSAFLLLYMQLAEQSRTRRTLYVVGCGISSLLAALVVLPAADSIGYCGLSGICHGIMIICAMELTKNASTKQAGFLCLYLIVGKCLFEAFTGNMLFSFFHADMIGCPVALAHGGGALGGYIMYTTFHGFSFIPASRKRIKVGLQYKV